MANKKDKKISGLASKKQQATVNPVNTTKKKEADKLTPAKVSTGAKKTSGLSAQNISSAKSWMDKYGSVAKKPSTLPSTTAVVNNAGSIPTGYNDGETYPFKMKKFNGTFTEADKAFTSEYFSTSKDLADYYASAASVGGDYSKFTPQMLVDGLKWAERSRTGAVVYGNAGEYGVDYTDADGKGNKYDGTISGKTGIASKGETEQFNTDTQDKIISELTTSIKQQALSSEDGKGDQIIADAVESLYEELSDASGYGGYYQSRIQSSIDDLLDFAGQNIYTGTMRRYVDRNRAAIEGYDDTRAYQMEQYNAAAKSEATAGNEEAFQRASSFVTHPINEWRSLVENDGEYGEQIMEAIGYDPEMTDDEFISAFVDYVEVDDEAGETAPSNGEEAARWSAEMSETEDYRNSIMGRYENFSAAIEAEDKVNEYNEAYPDDEVMGYVRDESQPLEIGPNDIVIDGIVMKNERPDSKAYEQYLRRMVSYMSDSEKARYSFIYDTEGAESAKEYYDALKTSRLNRQHATEFQEQSYQWTHDITGARERQSEAVQQEYDEITAEAERIVNDPNATQEDYDALNERINALASGDFAKQYEPGFFDQLAQWGFNAAYLTAAEVEKLGQNVEAVKAIVDKAQGNRYDPYDIEAHPITTETNVIKQQIGDYVSNDSIIKSWNVQLPEWLGGGKLVEGAYGVATSIIENLTQMTAAHGLGSLLGIEGKALNEFTKNVTLAFMGGVVFDDQLYSNAITGNMTEDQAFGKAVYNTIVELGTETVLSLDKVIEAKYGTEGGFMSGAERWKAIKGAVIGEGYEELVAELLDYIPICGLDSELEEYYDQALIDISNGGAEGLSGDQAKWMAFGKTISYALGRALMSGVGGSLSGGIMSLGGNSNREWISLGRSVLASDAVQSIETIQDMTRELGIQSPYSEEVNRIMEENVYGQEQTSENTGTADNTVTEQDQNNAETEAEPQTKEEWEAYQREQEAEAQRLSQEVSELEADEGSSEAEVEQAKGMLQQAQQNVEAAVEAQMTLLDSETSTDVSETQPEAGAKVEDDSDTNPAEPNAEAAKPEGISLKLDNAGTVGESVSVEDLQRNLDGMQAEAERRAAQIRQLEADIGDGSTPGDGRALNRIGRQISRARAQLNRLQTEIDQTADAILAAQDAESKPRSEFIAGDQVQAVEAESESKKNAPVNTETVQTSEQVESESSEQTKAEEQQERSEPSNGKEKGKTEADVAAAAGSKDYAALNQRLDEYLKGKGAKEFYGMIGDMYYKTLDALGVSVKAMTRQDAADEIKNKIETLSETDGDLSGISDDVIDSLAAVASGTATRSNYRTLDAYTRRNDNNTFNQIRNDILQTGFKLSDKTQQRISIYNELFGKQFQNADRTNRNVSSDVARITRAPTGELNPIRISTTGSRIVYEENGQSIPVESFGEYVDTSDGLRRVANTKSGPITVDVNWLGAIDENESEIIKYSAAYGDAGIANALNSALMTVSGANVTNVANAASMVYMMGMSGANAQNAIDYLNTRTNGKVKLSNDLVEKLINKATADRNQRNKGNHGNVWNRSKTRYTGITINANGTMTANGKQLTNDQMAKMKIIEKLANVIGFNVEFTGGGTLKNDAFVQGNGFFNPGTNTISVDVFAGLETINDTFDDNTMLNTLSHELAHYIQAWSSDSYMDLCESIMDMLTKNGENIDSLINSKYAGLAKSIKGWNDLTDAQQYAYAYDEVVAEGLSRMLMEEEAMQRFAQEHSGIFRKIVDFFKNLLQDLKDMIAKERVAEDTQEAKTLRALEGYADLIQKTYNALESASAAAQEAMIENADAGPGMTEVDGAVVSEEIADYMESDEYVDPNKRDQIRTTVEWRRQHQENYPKDMSFEMISALVDNFNQKILMSDAARYAVPHGIVSSTRTDRDASTVMGASRKGGENAGFGKANIGPLRSNEEYGFTFDLDTKCERTYNYLYLRNAIQNTLGRQLTSFEARQLIEVMRVDKRYMIPCTYCYVEGKRMMLADGYAKTISKESKKSVGYKATSGDVFKAVEACRTIVNGYMDSVYNVPENYVVDTSTQVMDEDGNIIFEGYRDFWMPKGAKLDNIVRDICERYNVPYEEKLPKEATEGMSKEEKARYKFKFGAQKTIANQVSEWIYNHKLDTPVNLSDHETDWRTGTINYQLLNMHDRAVIAAQGGVKANVVKDYVPYTDEVIRITPEEKAHMNAMGGARIHSSNDFQVGNLQDYLLFFSDLAADKRGVDGEDMGWFVHTYSKNLIFADIFSRFGARINCSVAFYTDSNGKVIPNEHEGCNQQQLKKLRKRNVNIGSMAMVTDNRQLTYAMNADWIDMIIPFHASGMPAEMFYDVMGWQNYTSIQGETEYSVPDMKRMIKAADRNAKTGASKADVMDAFWKTFEKITDDNVPKNAAEVDKLLAERAAGENKIVRITKKNSKGVDVEYCPHFFPYDSTDKFGNFIPGHGNSAERYKQLCDLYGGKPRFAGMKVYDKASKTVVDITDHPGYVKLIKETARTDTKQKYISMDNITAKNGDGRSAWDVINEAIEMFTGYEGFNSDPGDLQHRFIKDYVGENGEPIIGTAAEVLKAAKKGKKMYTVGEFNEYDQALSDRNKAIAERAYRQREARQEGLFETLEEANTYEDKKDRKKVMDAHYLAANPIKSQQEVRRQARATKEYIKALPGAIESAVETLGVQGDYASDPYSTGAGENAEVRYSLRVDDNYRDAEGNKVKEQLEKEFALGEGVGYIKTMRSMQIVDGLLYSPMAGIIDDKTSDRPKLPEGGVVEGEIERAVEHPDAVDKNGKFKLDKGNGSSVPAAYNPYMHSTDSVLNDQFSSAYQRDNVVTVECWVPMSEVNGTYHAEGAKDPIGWAEWKSGPVANDLRRYGIVRNLMLSRYIKIVKVMSSAEVAQAYSDLLKGTDISIPMNVVTPGVRAELEKIGVPMRQSKEDNYQVTDEYYASKAVERDNDTQTYNKLIERINKKADEIVELEHKTGNTEKVQKAYTTLKKLHVDYINKRFYMASNYGDEYLQTLERLDEMKIWGNVFDGQSATGFSDGTEVRNQERNTDSDYMEAVDSGDMESAQDMVDHAAEIEFQGSKIRDDEGKLLPVYHGSTEDFNVFDMTKGRANMDIQGSFFTPWDIDAEGYGENVRRFYLNITNPAPESVGYKALNKFKGQNNAGVKARELLISMGYDGVNNSGEEFIAFYPEQIKSADPVTYDDNGKLIPLSERFNSESDDVRNQARWNRNPRDVAFAEGDQRNAYHGALERNEWRYVYSQLTSLPKYNLNNYEVGDAAVVKCSDKVVFMEYNERRNGKTGELEGDFKAIDVYRFTSEELINSIPDEVIRVGGVKHGTYFDEWLQVAAVGTGKGLLQRYDIELGVYVDISEESGGLLRGSTGVFEGRNGYRSSATQMDSEEDERTEEGNRFQDRTRSVTDQELIMAASNAIARTDTERQYLETYKKAVGKLVDVRTQYEQMQQELKDARESGNIGEMMKIRDRMHLMEKRIEMATEKTVRMERETPIKSVLQNIREETERAVIAAMDEVRSRSSDTMDEAIERLTARYDKRIAALEERIRQERKKGKIQAAADADRQATEDAFRQAHQMEKDQAKIRALEQQVSDLKMQKEALRINKNARIQQEIQKRVDAVQSMRDSRMRAEFSSKIRNVIDDLNRRLAHPKEGHFMPAGMAREVIAALESFDMSYKKNGEELVPKKIAEMREVYERYKDDAAYVGIYNPQLDAYMKTLIDNLEGVKFRDLSKEKMVLVYNAMKGIQKVIADANDLKSGVLGGRKVGKTVGQMISDIEDADAKIPKWLEGAANFQLTPDNAFNRAGGYAKGNVMSLLQKMFVQGEQRMLEIQRLFANTFKNYTSENRFFELGSINEKKLVDVGLKNMNSDGSPILLTRSMMLALYMHLSSEDNFNAIARGGLNVPNLKKYYKGDIAGSYGSHEASIRTSGAQQRYSAYLQGIEQSDTAADDQIKEFDEFFTESQNELDIIRANIESELTDFERDLIASAHMWNDTISREMLNEVSMDMLGFKKANVENYFPIRRDKNFVKKQFDSIAFDGSIAGAGFMKERVAASQPVLLADFIYEMQSSADQVSKYVGFVQAERDFNILFNGMRPGFTTSVKEALSNKFGLENYKFGVNLTEYIENYVKDITGTRERAKQDIFDMIRGNMARYTLTANVRVAFSQLASIPTGAGVLGWKAVSKGLATGFTAAFSQQQKEDIAQRNAWYWNRYRGEGSTREMSEAKNADNALDRAYNKVARSAVGKRVLNWCQDFDCAATAILYKAAESWATDNTDYSKGSAEWQNAVDEIYTETLRKSQPMYSVTERSDLMRTPNKMLKFLTMFKTQASQNFNMLWGSIAEYNKMAADLKAGKEGVTSEDVRVAKKNLINSTSAVASGAIAFAMLRMIVNLLTGKVKKYRDDDDKVTLDKVLEATTEEAISSLSSMVAFGSEIYDVIHSSLTGDKYYGLEETSTAQLAQLIEDSQTLISGFNGKSGNAFDWDGDGWEDAKDAVADVFVDLSTIFGIPVGNFQNMFDSAISAFKDVRDGTLFAWNNGVSRKEDNQYNLVINEMINTGEAPSDEKISSLMKMFKKKTTDSVLNGIKGRIVDRYEEGRITREDAISLSEMLGYNESDVYWQLDLADYKNSHNGKEDGHRRTLRLESAFKSGDEDQIKSALAELDLYTGQSQTVNVKDAAYNLYKEGMTWPEVEAIIRKYTTYGKGKQKDLEKSIFFIKDKVDYELANPTKTWKKYGTLFDAMESGDNPAIAARITEMMNHKVSVKDICSAIKSEYADTYNRLLESDPDKAELLLTNVLLPAFELLGYSEAKEREYIKKNW